MTCMVAATPDTLPPVDRWQRLGAEIRSARARRGWRTMTSFAQATGLGVRTLGDLERGARDTFTDETLAVVEQVLGWAPGSAQAVLGGGKPRPDRVRDRHLARLVQVWPELSRDARVMLVELAERAAGRG